MPDDLGGMFRSNESRITIFLHTYELEFLKSLVFVLFFISSVGRELIFG